MKTDSLSKLTLVSFAYASASLSAFSAPEDYTNVLVQKPVNTGIPYLVPDIPASGSQSSPLPISEGGAVFELRSIHKPTQSTFVLDTKFVGSYSAKVEVKTLDPYTAVKRTRIDVPYTVSVTGIPASLQSLALNELGLQWNGERYSSDKGFADGYQIDYAKDPVSLTLGAFVDGKPVYSAFKSDSNLKNFAGEEVYSVWALSAAIPSVSGILDGVAGVLEPVLMDSETVQIWPMASTTVTGLSAGAVYRKFDPITVTINNLYPDDSYAVDVTDGTNVYEIQSSVRRVESVSWNAVINFVDLAADVQEQMTLLGQEGSMPKGNYTLRVWQQSPSLDAERNLLYSVNFAYNPVLKIRAVVD